MYGIVLLLHVATSLNCSNSADSGKILIWLKLITLLKEHLVFCQKYMVRDIAEHLNSSW